MGGVIVGAWRAWRSGGAELPSSPRLAAVTGLTDPLVEDVDSLRVAIAGAPTDIVGAGGRLAALEGEIYNLRALTRDAGIGAAGPALSLMLLHDRIGDAMLPALRGDFVFLFWDGRRREGWVARDQTAGRGLVYAERGRLVLFGSEVRQLLDLLPSAPEPDAVTMAHWINGGGPPGDRTLFAGIRRLPPGHLLRLRDGGPRAERYWTPQYGGVLEGSRDELAAGLRQVVGEAVRRRLAGREPPGLLLSGGLDSGAVAALATDGTAADRRPRMACSAVFPDHAGIDESRLIRAVAADRGLDVLRAEVRGGPLLPAALEYLRTWRVPPTSPNLFFWLELLRAAAARGVRSLLDGEGGDQVFGLSPYLLADRVRRARLISAVRLASRMPGAGPSPPWRLVRGKIAHVGVRGALPTWVQGVRRSVSPAERYAVSWLLPHHARAFVETDTSWRWREQSGPRWWGYLVSETTSGVGPALTLDHIRRRSAMAGITARHPLLDVDVLEYMFRVPPETAYDARISRPLFRASLAGLLRDDVRMRPDKSSFDAVFHESLLGHDASTIRRLLLGDDAEIRRYVDQERLRAELLDLPPHRHPGGLVWWAVSVWRATTAECFLRSLADHAGLEKLIADARALPPELRLRFARATPSAAVS